VDPVKRVLTLLVLVPALALPAVAGARPATLAPPGNPAISQYLEVVPTDGGGSPPSSSHSHGNGALTSAQRHALVRRGAAGRALAAVVDATAPGTTSAAASQPQGVSGTPSAPAATGSGGHENSASGQLSAGGVRSPLSSVLAAATGHGGGGGMGILLPALLVGGVLVAAVIGLRRRGTASS
jgi:hypothetical protein